MRITLDGTPLLGRRTGIGTYVARLVDALPEAVARRGLDARVDVTTWSLRGGRVEGLPPTVRQTGPRVPARALRAAWQRVDAPAVELLVGRTDVVHGTNFVSPPTVRAREVVTVHDLAYVHLPATVSADSARYRVLVPRALRRGAHVLVPSGATGRAVREHYGLGADRVSVTPLGVDASWSSAVAAPAEVRDAMGVGDDYLLFVGSLEPRKNLPRLLRAHAALRAQDPGTPVLVLAGPAGRDLHVREQAGVVRTGWLDDDTLRGLVAGARAVLLPSLDEGFGLPVLEAMAAGRPVLAGDVPALREVGGRHATYAAPTDVDALADGLDRVLRTPDDAAARASRQAWAAGFTWARTADTTLDAYVRAAA
ncbi:glycosyltransferase family 4 protein [Cellulomonas sp. NPDC057328]|uniref:glycosyltransferase family 4 protein n=1 Tax=Cellulomonas sp. NPDC057328 TaxID=3346101 RepID=UPI0036284A64